MIIKPIKVSEIYCNICGKKKDEVSMLHAGIDAFICNECVEKCKAIQTGNFKKSSALKDFGTLVKELQTSVGETKKKSVKGSDLSCNWCGKNGDEVSKLHLCINAFICNECVDICIGIQNGDQKYNDLAKVIKDLRTALDENVNK